jgi:hypothetical protein
MVAPRRKLKTSPVAILKSKHVELIHEIEHLKEQLAAAQHRDGSLFDLKQDKPEDIATAIVASVSETKARNIAKAIVDGIAAKRQQQKPAG